jgi:hypothetical protein
LIFNLQQLPIKRTTRKFLKALLRNTFKNFLGLGLSAKRCMTYTKAKNGYAIFCFENLYWVWFLIRKSVATLSGIGITQKKTK